MFIYFNVITYFVVFEANQKTYDTKSLLRLCFMQADGVKWKKKLVLFVSCQLHYAEYNYLFYVNIFQ
jgi:hypothetical protein